MEDKRSPEREIEGKVSDVERLLNRIFETDTRARAEVEEARQALAALPEETEQMRAQMREQRREKVEKDLDAWEARRRAEAEEETRRLTQESERIAGRLEAAFTEKRAAWLEESVSSVTDEA